MSDLPTDGDLDPIDPADPSDDLDLDLPEDAEDMGGEAEPGEDEPGEEPAAPSTPAATGRRARGQTFGAQLRERDGKIEALERTIAEIRRDQQQPKPPTQAEIAEQQRVERERFEMMSPYEQFQYTQAKIAEGVNRQTQQVAGALWDQADRREYEDLLEKTPAYRRLDGRVAELRAQAPGVPRKVLLATAIGLRALEQGGAARTRATTQAATRRQRQEAPASRGGSDVSPGRGGRDELEQRLRGARI